MKESLSIDHFKPLLHEAFVFPVQDQEDIQFTLEEVNPLTQHFEEGRVPFSLIFRGPSEPAIPQGTYVLNHSKLEKLVLFLVPVATGEKGTMYESLFN